MRAYMMVKYLFLLAAISLLASCSLLSPVKSKPANAYMIASLPRDVPTKRKTSTTIMVMQPDTVPAYNTTDMAYSRRVYQVSYYARNRWAETPGQMLQPLIVQTLQNTHHFHAIVTPPFVGRYDYVLTTTILKLQQDFTCCPPILKLRVRAQLTKVSSNEVVATKEFCVLEPMRGGTPYCGVIAANRAAREFLRELAEFVLRI